ncbi:MAG: aldose 1-epimerase [Clostridia bacterium]|nr:aldose 1-epimerase [Clostridia bacterium]
MSRIHLRSSAYTATLDLDHGANCISLRHIPTGATILREPPAEPDSLFLYGLPILFPVNRISGGQFDFDGRTYTFPINEPATGCHLHGTLSQLPFVPTAMDDAAITCLFSAESGEYLGFPHAFSIGISYALTDDELVHIVTVTNRSAERMPCLLGFHTTFNAIPFPDSCPADMRVQADIAEEYARDMHNYLPNGEKPPLDALSTALAAGTLCPIGQPISRHYRAAPNGRMRLYDVRQGLSVVYAPDPALGFRLIYNGTADGYICLEPQIALANSPNAPISREEAGFAWLEPYEHRSFRSTIHVHRI